MPDEAREAARARQVEAGAQRPHPLQRVRAQRLEAAIESLAKAIARSRAQKVIVYGDGDDPDTGEQLGKEISGKGIKKRTGDRRQRPAL